MAVTITHAFVSAIPDGLDATLVRSSNWNDLHAINMATSRLLGRSTAGTGAAEEISIGSGLSLTSGTLSASGGGGATLTISNKTGAYTVVAGDLGTIINCTSGTFTVSLTAAATLGAGFNCTIWNTSVAATDAITIDPSGTETIDGVTTLILRRGEGLQIVCDGTNWQTGDKKTMRGYAENISSTTARASASGIASIAIGDTALASGTSSTALGANTSATGSGSLALGINASATVANATAIGRNSSAQGAQAVTGGGAMALGGSYASGTDSFAAAVANNTSTYGSISAGSVAIGYQTKVIGSYGVALGASNSGIGSIAASGSFAVMGGDASTANSAAAIGRNCVASGLFSTAIGYYAGTQNLIGKYAFTGNRFASIADSQFGALVLRCVTTDGASTALFSSDVGPANTTNQVILPNNAAYAFSGIIVARRQAAGGTESAAWKVEGLIRREGTAASTTLVASTVTAISNVPGWTLALSADTTNGGLAVTATGAAATNIRWVATIQTSEVTYA